MTDTVESIMARVDKYAELREHRGEDRTEQERAAIRAAVEQLCRERDEANGWITKIQAALYRWLPHSDYSEQAADDATLLYGLCEGDYGNEEGQAIKERAERAEQDADELRKANIALRAMLREPRQHKYWGAGEPDCPRDIKAPNGELHTLRCKVCGLDSPRNDICLHAIDAAMKEGK